MSPHTPDPLPKSLEEKIEAVTARLKSCDNQFQKQSYTRQLMQLQTNYKMVTGHSYTVKIEQPRPTRVNFMKYLSGTHWRDKFTL